MIPTRGPGDIFGWSWIFPGEEWKFKARVVDQVKAIVIHTPCLHGKIENDAELAYELLRRFAGSMVDRIQATPIQLMDIYRPA